MRKLLEDSAKLDNSRLNILQNKIIKKLGPDDDDEKYTCIQYNFFLIFYVIFTTLTPLVSTNYLSQENDWKF